jgi:nucleoid-associated protein YgaU
MLSRRHVLSALGLLALLALVAPAVALAQSAGNSQYIDPLANQTQTTTTSRPAPSGSQPTTSAPSLSAPSPAPANSAPASSAPAGSAPAATTVSSRPATTQQSDATTQSSSATLPFTGLDLAPTLAVAIGLLGAGAALRRITRRT